MRRQGLKVEGVIRRSPDKSFRGSASAKAGAEPRSDPIRSESPRAICSAACCVAVARRLLLPLHQTDGRLVAAAQAVVAAAQAGW